MAMPQWLTRVNLVFTNRITSLIAGWAPWFCILEHVGRRSGTVRRTPLNVFRHGARYVFALTYGPDVQWVANILAAGECRIRTRNRWVSLTEPRRFRDPNLSRVPWVVQPVLVLFGVDEFLEMRAASSA